VRNSFNQKSLYDTTPLPESIPKVKELGASSAPLLSASFFIGARCKDYNDDYMQCKNENPGRGEFECMKEGRRVTRCARSVYVSPDTERMEEPLLLRRDCLLPFEGRVWADREF
jgi:NADH dehydrogenase (ubiquinone) 1 alpha subcomplex subunit 8